MILIVLLVCFVGAFAQTPSKKLEGTILSFKDQMPCNDLVPLYGDFFNLYHKQLILKIYGSASDFTIWGLNDFDILDVNLNVLTLKLNAELKFNKIRAKGKYDIESFVISILKLHGNGDFDITLEDFRVSVYARVGMIDGVLRMMDLDVVLNMKKMKSKFTGLMGPLGTFILSSVVDTVMVNYFRDNAEDITDNIREMVLPSLDETLQQYTVKDLLELLQSSPEPEEECIPNKFQLY